MGAVIDGGLVVNNGLVVTTSAILPANCITNTNIPAAAGVEASKLQHQYEPCYSQSGNAAAATVVLHIVKGATATVQAVRAVSVAAATGDSTATIDVKKNGTTIISAPIVLDSGNTAYVLEAGTLTVPAGVAGDVYTAVITISAGSGTLPTGLSVQLVIREDA
jgi:hypothetical protein